MMNATYTSLSHIVKIGFVFLTAYCFPSAISTHRPTCWSPQPHLPAQGVRYY